MRIYGGWNTMLRELNQSACSAPKSHPRKFWTEVGDSSHMTWLESDSSRKFKDLWLAWLNKENDLTWDPVTWDLTWPSWLSRTWLYNNSNYYYKSLRHNLVNKTQATEPAAEVIGVCTVHDTARAQQHTQRAKYREQENLPRCLD